MTLARIIRPAPCTGVEDLCAVHEIRQLALLYAHAVDARDRELLTSLWSRSAAPARYPTIDIHGLQRDLDGWFHAGPTILLVANHLVSLTGADRAEGRVTCWAQLDLGDRFVDQSILYEDAYVCEGGTWLFATRRHLLWYGAAREGHPLRQEPAEWPRSQVGTGIAATELHGS